MRFTAITGMGLACRSSRVVAGTASPAGLAGPGAVHSVGPIRTGDGSEAELKDHRERDGAMRPKRASVSVRSTVGRVFARRARSWQLIPASVVAAALGGAVTVAAHGATATDSEAAGQQLAGIASQAQAALGTGVVDPVVRPYLDPKQLRTLTCENEPGDGRHQRRQHAIAVGLRRTCGHSH